MSAVILGTYYPPTGDARPETLLISFLDWTLRIRLEPGARTAFNLPFRPVTALIQEARGLEASEDRIVEMQRSVHGHYSDLHNSIDLSAGDILVTYWSNGTFEKLAFSAPDCGKLEVLLERLLPQMGEKIRRTLR